MTTKQLAEKLLEAKKLADDGHDESILHFRLLTFNNITELCTAYLKLEKQLDMCKFQRNVYMSASISDYDAQAKIHDQELEKVEG